MCRHDGLPVSAASVLRLLREEGLLLGWHTSPTANQHDAISTVELALAEAECLTGQPLRDLAPRDADGNIEPLITIVTNNGGPFRSFRFDPPPRPGTARRADPDPALACRADRPAP